MANTGIPSRNINSTRGRGGPLGRGGRGGGAGGAGVSRPSRGGGTRSVQIRPGEEQRWLAQANAAGPPPPMGLPAGGMRASPQPPIIANAASRSLSPKPKRERPEDSPNLAAIPLHMPAGSKRESPNQTPNIKSRHGSPVDLDTYAWRGQSHMSNLVRYSGGRAVGKPQDQKQFVQAYKTTMAATYPQQPLVDANRFTEDLLLWEADRTPFLSMSIEVFESYCNQYLGGGKTKDERSGRLRQLTAVEKAAYLSKAKTHYDAFVAEANRRRVQRIGRPAERAVPL